MVDFREALVLFIFDMKVLEGANDFGRNLFLEIADFIIVENDDFKEQEYKSGFDFSVIIYF